MARNFSPVGNELQINLSPNQDGFQGLPAAAAMSDGRFFVTFLDVVASGPDDLNVIGQFVSADGTLLGGNIDVETDIGVQFGSTIAARAGGAALVVWQDVESAEEIHYAIVSNVGVVGTEQTLLDGGLFSSPDVATLADGRSLVVATGDNADLDIAFRFIDAGGNPIGTMDFVDNGAGDQDEAVVAAYANNALVVYEEDVAPDNVDVHARFFNGTSFAAEVTIADTSGIVENPDVAALTDGRFVVVYENGDNDKVEGRLISATGVPLGSAFTISGTAGFNDDAHVAALPDGGFIVTWETDDAKIAPEIRVADLAVVAQRFNSTGAPAGDVFLVNAGDPLTNQDDPVVATNTTTGQTYIAWEDGHVYGGAGEDSDPFGVRGHAFVTAIDVVNGTVGDDIITTFNLSEPIHGLAGADLINGLGGDDIIHGGAGFDQIKGGLGNDQLFGDSGEDLLKGEDGNDLLVGGVGRDVQFGGSGADTFDFNRVVESRVGATHDLIRGFSHAQDDTINLQTIDADTTAVGNQAFDLIGATAFSGTAGELRFASGLLQGDTNGDGIANFEIRVTGLGTPVNGDFVL